MFRYRDVEPQVDTGPVVVGDGKAELRRSKRLKIFQPALLAGSAGTIRIHLLDVSRTGALAYADGTAPAAGLALHLECSGVRAAATVRWTKGSRFGLLFHSPLAAAQLSRITQAGASLELKATPQAPGAPSAA